MCIIFNSTEFLRLSLGLQFVPQELLSLERPSQYHHVECCNPGTAPASFK
jgi:hypothetical protein